uniref:Endonuclease n=1 Tax=Spongospora subterranea TaxID=70186 RepID=A0A0H5R9P4_9EUKA|eukprot:CRZ10516.1 hypothetical protein [Spongospora subterranea]
MASDRVKSLVILAGSLGICTGWATAVLFFVLEKRTTGPVKQDDYGKIPLPDHDAAKYGLPNSMGLRVQKEYVVAFDWRTRNPLWVAQTLKAEDRPKDRPSRQGIGFTVDKSVPQLFRTHAKDFTNSGFDRGHLAPAGDSISQEGLKETFLMVNISPQVGKGFNQDYLVRFEQFVRRLLNRYEEVNIISGPLFIPESNNANVVQYPVIENNIAVPTHFFKAVLTSKSTVFGGKQYQAATFIFPNKPIDPSTKLLSFRVPLKHLESKAGLLLWDQIDRSQISDLCSPTAIDCSLGRLAKNKQKTFRQGI